MTTVSVKLGAFATEALARKLRSGGLPAAGDFEGVIQFYLGEKSTQAAGWAYPDFLRERRASDEVELELDVDGPLWGMLEAEARDQEVTVDRLLEHATLYYAAEIDAGRATARILEDLEREERPGDAS